MKKIIYTRPDGGVSIINPSPNFLATFQTEQDGLDAIIAKDVPGDASDVQTVDASSIPTDRTFRDALRQTAGVFSVDMVKARETHTANIAAAKMEMARKLAEREMLGEDILLEKATLQGMDDKTEIDAADDPDTLKAIWPTGLVRI